jgi:hypothetical protein
MSIASIRILKFLVNVTRELAQLAMLEQLSPMMVRIIVYSIFPIRIRKGNSLKRYSES